MIRRNSDVTFSEEKKGGVITLRIECDECEAEDEVMHTDRSEAIWELWHRGWRVTGEFFKEHYCKACVRIREIRRMTS